MWASEFFSVRRGPHVVNRMENDMPMTDDPSDAMIFPPAIRQCFAFNQNKQRCDMPGGHPGDHSITVGWSDEECYDPTTEVTLTVREYGVALPSHGETEHLVDVPEELEDCAVCEHAAEYHPMQGPCILGQCDCKNYVG